MVDRATLTPAMPLLPPKANRKSISDRSRNIQQGISAATKAEW